MKRIIRGELNIKSNVIPSETDNAKIIKGSIKNNQENKGVNMENNKKLKELFKGYETDKYLLEILDLNDKG